MNERRFDLEYLMELARQNPKVDNDLLITLKDEMQTMLADVRPRYRLVLPFSGKQARIADDDSHVSHTIRSFRR